MKRHGFHTLFYRLQMLLARKEAMAPARRSLPRRRLAPHMRFFRD